MSSPTNPAKVWQISTEQAAAIIGNRKPDMDHVQEADLQAMADGNFILDFPVELSEDAQRAVYERIEALAKAEQARRQGGNDV